jgi:hypothetical protein
VTEEELEFIRCRAPVQTVGDLGVSVRQDADKFESSNDGQMANAVLLSFLPPERPRP